MRSNLRLPLWLSLIALLLPAVHAVGQEEQANPEQLWDDVVHYTRIVRVDLAKDAAIAFMEATAQDPDLFLDTIKASIDQGRVRDVEEFLRGATKFDTLKPIAEELLLRYQAAKIRRIRDPKNIMEDIERLDDGPRPFALAVERLRAAGQFAAPQMLAVLNDDRKQDLHIYVRRAMVIIGRPMVYPLAVALHDLEPVTRLVVARVLADIGYPQALPYVKEVLDNTADGSAARATFQAAYDQLARGRDLAENVSAAALFHADAESLYQSATAKRLIQGFDPQTGKGILWKYVVSANTGLVAVEVPGDIYGNVRAMDSARRALKLDPDMSRALTLWLTANLRRENWLPEGETDPSYPASRNAPAFFAMAAGPRHLQKILTTALNDRDPALALDAVSGLIKTGGSDVLFESDDSMRPLVQALNFPDREVRLHVAWALAEANPTETYAGSHRVVPTLIEGIRQTGNRYALVLSTTDQNVNTLKATARDLGFEAIGGTSLKQVVDAVNASPGIDLIIAEVSGDALQELVNATALDFRLASVPVLAIGSEGLLIDVRKRFADDPRVSATLQSDNPAELLPAVEQAVAAYAGNPISPDRATDYALRSLNMLDLLARTRSEIYNANDALPALIQALRDQRPEVVVSAAYVLSLLDNIEAQQALADAALDASRNENVRIELLGALADSMRQHGRTLNNNHVQNLRELVNTASGPLAVAAGRAAGAGDLATSDVVKLLPE